MLPRRKNGKFAKKASSNTISTLPKTICTDISYVSPEVTSVTPLKRRRRTECDVMSNNHYYSEKRSPVSLKHEGVHFIMESKGLNYGDPYKRLKRAMKANEARNFTIDLDGDMYECSPDSRRMVGEGLQASRRCAIAYVFEHLYGNPDKSEWAGHGGVLSKVMRRLDIPSNSMHLVRKVFEDVAQAINDKKPYDPHSGPRVRGRRVAIKLGSREANIVFIGMKSGIGITETTVLVNEYRSSASLQPICWSAVRNFIHRHPKHVELHKRAVKKSGKDDPDSPWAQARAAQACQIRNTTANKGTRYERKIVGDSPEMCRALDSHGFADLKAGLFTYASFTSLYPADDPRRFHLGTPHQLFSSIERTWRVTPTSKRIIEDIELLPAVLDKIIEARGCVVQDEEFRGLRNGRRAEGSGQLAPKVRKHQRLAQMASGVPDIPDIAEAKMMVKTGLEGRGLMGGV